MTKIYVFLAGLALGMWFTLGVWQWRDYQNNQWTKYGPVDECLHSYEVSRTFCQLRTNVTTGEVEIRTINIR